MTSEQPRWRRGEVFYSPVATQHVGATLAELLVVMAIMAIVLAYATLRLAQAADRTAVRSAAAEATTAFNGARQAAITRRGSVAVLIDTISLRLQIVADTEVLSSRDLGTEYGIRLGSSRDSMAYDAHGVGLGAANLSLVVRRGRAAETVFVSRLGRVRH